MTKKASNLLAGYEFERLEPIVFNVPAIYSEKVKMHDWQMPVLAEPRDNADFFPPKGHLHMASYRRLGNYDEAAWTTETQSMLAQIKLKKQYEPVYAQRSMLNMHTFAMMEEDEPGELHMPEALLDPEEAQRMDYRTMSEVHYRLPYPLKPRPPPPPPPPEPWLMNRRAVGWNVRDLETRPGLNTFLDDNLDLHLHIAQLKSGRSRTNDLLLNLDPTVCPTAKDNVASKETACNEEKQEDTVCS